MGSKPEGISEPLVVGRHIGTWKNGSECGKKGTQRKFIF